MLFLYLGFKWLIFSLISWVINIFCYLTNPIVCLFANEVGDLPGVLSYWQTWDDSCDVDWFVKEEVPKFLRYDFDAKYTSSRQQTEELKSVNRDRGCVILKENATFSLKERIQRYFCRVLWLTRNCAYGFNFWLLGAYVSGNTMVYKIKNDLTTIGYNTDYFIIHSDAPIGQIGKLKFYWKVFIGWKIAADTTVKTLCMLANRVVIRIEVVK